jgi:hypothetical protein
MVYAPETKDRIKFSDGKLPKLFGWSGEKKSQLALGVDFVTEKLSS